MTDVLLALAGVVCLFGAWLIRRSIVEERVRTMGFRLTPNEGDVPDGHPRWFPEDDPRLLVGFALSTPTGLPPDDLPADAVVMAGVELQINCPLELALIAVQNVSEMLAAALVRETAQRASRN